MSSPIPARPESIELIGGHVAVDLVNTVSWRQDPARRRENLVGALDLMTWARRALVLDQGAVTALSCAMADDPATAERALRRVHQLREHLYQHLARCIDHREGSLRVQRGSPLHRMFADAVTSSSLDGAPARWNLEAHTPRDLPRVLALHALDLLQTASGERLGRCDDDGCGWLFLDRTRNHSRRWCSSRECGNRHRARRHYTRTRTSPPKR